MTQNISSYYPVGNISKQTSANELQRSPSTPKKRKIVSKEIIKSISDNSTKLSDLLKATQRRRYEWMGEQVVATLNELSDEIALDAIQKINSILISSKKSQLQLHAHNDTSCRKNEGECQQQKKYSCRVALNNPAEIVQPDTKVVNAAIYDKEDIEIKLETGDSVEDIDVPVDSMSATSRFNSSLHELVECPAINMIESREKVKSENHEPCRINKESIKHKSCGIHEEPANEESCGLRKEFENHESCAIHETILHSFKKLNERDEYTLSSLKEVSKCLERQNDRENQTLRALKNVAEYIRDLAITIQEIKNN